MIKITQHNIAKILNVTQGSVSLYKRGKRKLSYSQAKILKKELGWSDDDLDNFFQNNSESKKCEQELQGDNECA